MSTETQESQEQAIESNDDFNAGFEGTETPPTETPEPKAEPEAQQEEVKEAQEQPQYAQITTSELEQLRQAANLVQEIKSAQEKQFGTAFGKIGGIERILNEIKSSGGGAIQLSDTDFDELRAEFPELAELQIKGLKKVLERMGGVPAQQAIDQTKIEQLLQERLNPALETTATQVERKVEEKLLNREHKDWRQVIGTPDPETGAIPDTEYRRWLKEQPQEYQEKVSSSWDSEVIGESINTFKAFRDKQIADSKRRNRMTDAVPIKGDGGHASTPTGDDDFEAGFRSG